ncbi:MAG: ferrous iron transport protein A [Candidatus Eisenbacteria bacterium]
MTASPNVSLSTLSPGSAAMIVDVEGEGAFRRRLLDMGFTKGALVRVIKLAPFGDPIEYCIGGTHVTLRIQEAVEIIVQQVTPPPFCRKQDDVGRGRRLGRGLGRGRAWRTRNRSR